MFDLWETDSTADGGECVELVMAGNSCELLRHWLGDSETLMAWRKE